MRNIISIISVDLEMSRQDRMAAGEHDVASGHPVAIAEEITSLSEWH